MSMNREQVQALVISAEQHFKDLGWSEEDTSIEMVTLTLLLVTLLTSSLPVTAKKFPEVMRVLANAFEVLSNKKDTK